MQCAPWVSVGARCASHESFVLSVIISSIGNPNSGTRNIKLSGASFPSPSNKNITTEEDEHSHVVLPRVLWDFVL
jgi:hypothetical protein